MMMMSQLDPEARREMNTSMQMQLAQLNTIPGGQAMLENMLGGVLRESGNTPLTEIDRRAATEEHAAPQAGRDSNSEPLPNPWARPSQPAQQQRQPVHQPMGMNPFMMQMMQQQQQQGAGAPAGSNLMQQQQRELLQRLIAAQTQQFQQQPPPSTPLHPAAAPTPSAEPDYSQLAVSGDLREQRRREYKEQLRVLMEDMGFTDEEACLMALIQSNGDVDAAVDYLAQNSA